MKPASCDQQQGTQQGFLRPRSPQGIGFHFSGNTPAPSLVHKVRVGLSFIIWLWGVGKMTRSGHQRTVCCWSWKLIRDEHLTQANERPECFAGASGGQGAVIVLELQVTFCRERLPANKASTGRNRAKT